MKWFVVMLSVLTFITACGEDIDYNPDPADCGNVSAAQDVSDDPKVDVQTEAGGDEDVMNSPDMPSPEPVPERGVCDALNPPMVLLDGYFRGRSTRVYNLDTGQRLMQGPLTFFEEWDESMWDSPPTEFLVVPYCFSTVTGERIHRSDSVRVPYTVSFHFPFRHEIPKDILCSDTSRCLFSVLLLCGQERCWNANEREETERGPMLIVHGNVAVTAIDGETFETLPDDRLFFAVDSEEYTLGFYIPQ